MTRCKLWGRMRAEQVANALPGMVQYVTILCTGTAVWYIRSIVHRLPFKYKSRKKYAARFVQVDDVITLFTRVRMTGDYVQVQLCS